MSKMILIFDDSLPALFIFFAIMVVVGLIFFVLYLTNTETIEYKKEQNYYEIKNYMNLINSQDNLFILSELKILSNLSDENYVLLKKIIKNIRELYDDYSGCPEVQKEIIRNWNLFNGDLKYIQINYDLTKRIKNLQQTLIYYIIPSLVVNPICEQNLYVYFKETTMKFNYESLNQNIGDLVIIIDKMEELPIGGHLLKVNDKIAYGKPDPTKYEFEIPTHIKKITDIFKKYKTDIAITTNPYSISNVSKFNSIIYNTNISTDIPIKFESFGYINQTNIHIKWDLNHDKIIYDPIKIKTININQIEQNIFTNELDNQFKEWNENELKGEKEKCVTDR